MVVSRSHFDCPDGFLAHHNGAALCAHRYNYERDCSGAVMNRYQLQAAINSFDTASSMVQALATQTRDDVIALSGPVRDDGTCPGCDPEIADSCDACYLEYLYEVAEEACDQLERLLEIAVEASDRLRAMRARQRVNNAEDTETGLLPCPFCSSPHVIAQSVEDSRYYAVHCVVCGAHGPYLIDVGNKSATEYCTLVSEYWNTRHRDD